MTISKSPTIAIVGGGAVGAALIGALSDRLASVAWGPVKPRVVLFEKSAHVGRGVAYAKDSSRHLLNTNAHTMSVVPRRKTDFSAWLQERGLAPAGDGEHICARDLFGDYVEARFARAVEKARGRGINVSVVRDEVTSLVPRSSVGYLVATHQHAAVEADLVVLAVGNLPHRGFAELEGPRFIVSPYPSHTLRARIPARASVAILGTGLSAIDAALALFASGHEGSVTMASRSGLLPTVRGPLHDHTLIHVTPANVARATEGGRGPLRLATVLRWLELELAPHGIPVSWDHAFPAFADAEMRLAAEIAAAESAARPWQSVGEALNPMIEIIWHHLADEDRRLFLDRYRSRFMSHWVPIPIVTAKEVLRILRGGKLRVQRGLGGVTREANSYRLELDDGAQDFDFAIRATGAPRHLHESESSLLDSLVRRGTVAAHEAGGVRVDFESLRIVDAGDRIDPSLFALGHLTCGTHLFTSTLEMNVEKADRLAAHLTEELHRRREKEAHVDAAPHSS